jgi:myo-inositol-1(or 4)-monophosphatase
MSSVNELPVSPADLRAVLTAAGDIVRKHYESDLGSYRKEDGSPVTLADMETNQFLHCELGRLVPGAGWLSEESSDRLDRLDAEWVWVVDPIDGTKEFVRRVPELAVSVGLVCRHEAVLGGVLNPVTNEGAVGAVGCGLEAWGLPPALSPVAAAAEAIACVSRTETEQQSLAPLVALVRESRPIGSVAYKLLRVAAGVEHLTFSAQPRSEWDICGGVALLRAVGRVFERLDGQPCRFNQCDTRIRSGSAGGEPAIVRDFIRRAAQLPQGGDR